MNKGFIKKTTAALLIIATLLTLCSCSSGTASIKKGVDLVFTGANGHAKASVNADYETLGKSINAKKAAKYYAKLTSASFGGALTDAVLSEESDPDRLFRTFFRLVIADNSNELKNGDKVTVNVEVSEYMEMLGQTFKDVKKGTGCNVPETLEFKVSGLEDAKEIDAFANLSKIVKFKGANGHAKAYIDIDEDYSVADGTVTVSYGGYDNYLKVSAGGTDITSVKVTVEENENLNKGDKVAVSFEDSESLNNRLMDYGYVLKAETANATVPDLGEATEFDILSKVKDYVVFRGANGDGKAFISIPDKTEFKLGDIYFKRPTFRQDSLDMIYDNKEIGGISFEIEEGGTLKEGDKVELKLNTDSYALDTLEEHNIYPKTNKLELTVPDLGSYINSADELTAEDIAFLKKHALDEAAKDLDVPVTFYAVYFGKIKDSAAHKYSGKGVVKVIYYYEQTFIISTTTVGESYDYYDLCKDSKGNILFGETQTTGCSSSDTLVEDFDRNYTYSKLG